MFRSDRAMKTKTKPTPRARKMFANYYGDFVACHSTKTDAILLCDIADPASPSAIPVAVIPLHDPEALVDAAVTSHSHSYCGIATRRQAMRAALAAIGVLPKSKGGRK